jgi:8-oxo-dGTP pyrophosphatase MutT (NUDIX family)
MASSSFFSATSALRAADAVAALLILDDGRYLLQQRDDIPAIWYPGHWGCFGGAVEPGEELTDALRRELLEELELTPRAMDYFIRFDFDLSRLGQGHLHRTFFTVPILAAELGNLRLHEGAAMHAFAPAEIFDALRVTPYDSFALWLHHARGRLLPPDPQQA